MAHFLMPKLLSKGMTSKNFKRRSDGVLTSMTTLPAKKGKLKDEEKPKCRVVLWGGGKGGEILKLAASSKTGKLLAKTRLVGVETGHAINPDGEHLWFQIYELTIENAGVGTLTAVDGTGMPFARIELVVPAGDGTVLDVVQTLPGGELSTQASEKCVDPASVLPFKLPVRPSAGVKLSIRTCTAFVHDLLFKVKKDGVTFWVGACVPSATSDFTRAYVFFHPDTMGSADDATYTEFTGRWSEGDAPVTRYVRIQGVQLAEKENMVLLVPFMTAASRSGDSTTNMFASRGLDTLNTIMDACQIAIGRTSKGSKLARIGVASFSSGINNLVSFGRMIGGGIIKEQIDFDSAFMKNQHRVVERNGARNIQVTQMSPSDSRVTHSRAAADVWVHVDAVAWPTTNLATIHDNIGNFMFRAMIENTVV